MAKPVGSIKMLQVALNDVDVLCNKYSGGEPMDATGSQVNFYHGPGFDDHGSRVADLAVAAGRVIGLKSHEMSRLYLAALIHDVGKADISPTTLQKPSPLSAVEQNDVRQHCQIGHDQLNGLVHPSISESVLCHHENWDGSGYPLGIAGTGIPLLARIIFVADSFDVMTVGRPYQPPLGIIDAGECLTAASGQQFDPAVVDAFASIDRRLLKPVPAA